MPNVVGQIPDFTTDSSEQGLEEVKQTITPIEGTDTPTELPAEEEQKPASLGEGTNEVEIPKSDQQDLLNKSIERATTGLRNEIVELRRKLATATGNDRKLIQQDISKVQTSLDNLDDVNPDDVSLIEKVLRAKGYMTKEEAGRMNYETTKKEVLNNFLDRYPEYKPENDPEDLNWSSLQKELGLYRMPEDPRLINDILERAHRVIKPFSTNSDRSLPAKKRAIEVASMGAGGTGRSSATNKSLDADKKAMLRQGGFSDEDISNMEKRLS